MVELAHSEDVPLLPKGPVISQLPKEAQMAVYVEVLEFLKQQLPDVSDNVERSAVEIVDKFKSLALQTRNNGANLEEVIRVARDIELDGEVIPYEKSIEILYEPLAEAIDKILQVSKLAMSMVMTISNAADNIARVEECIEQVQHLTKQTNMLAMNTQIEAARAGEAGKSFRIIAQEVKGLSENIRRLSRQMQQEVGQVSASVKKSSKVIDNLAHYDMTENLELKDRIDALIESIMAKNEQFTSLLRQSANNAQKTAQDISSLVVGIQFQDRTAQVIGDLVRLLDKTIEHLRDSHPSDSLIIMQQRDSLDELVGHVIDEVNLSDIRNQTLEHLKHKGVLDESSPLVVRYLSRQSPPNGSHSGDDDDDIELF